MNDLQRALYQAVLDWAVVHAVTTWQRELVVYIAGMLSVGR